LTQGDQVSARKLRLFMCACCRHMWERIKQDAHRRAVEISEQFADGEVTDEVRKAADYLADRLIGSGALACRICVGDTASVSNARDVSRIAAGPGYKSGSPEKDMADKRRDQLHHAVLLRDIFGDTFQPVTFSPTWRTDTAVALARQMYESRDFGAMPIL